MHLHRCQHDLLMRRVDRRKSRSLPVGHMACRTLHGDARPVRNVHIRADEQLDRLIDCIHITGCICRDRGERQPARDSLIGCRPCHARYSIGLYRRCLVDSAGILVQTLCMRFCVQKHIFRNRTSSVLALALSASTMPLHDGDSDPIVTCVSPTLTEETALSSIRPVILAVSMYPAHAMLATA